MNPDIILITECKTGISSKTLTSIFKYARDSVCLMAPNMGLDRKVNWTQYERLRVLRRATTEYVLIMDDDDELILDVPSCESLDHDIIFYPFIQDGTEKRDFRFCSPYQICVFCGCILKREIALKALEYTTEHKYLREDIAFFCYLMENYSDIVFNDYPIINKIKQRDPKRSRFLSVNLRLELDKIWNKRLFNISKKSCF